jgi:hypothetical protein
MPTAQPCTLCRSTHYDLVHDMGWRRVLRCTGCRLVRADPLPSIDEKEAIETKGYTDPRDFPEVRAFFANCNRDFTEDPVIREMRRHLERLEHAAGGPGRLLDVGAGTVILMHLAQQRGWQPEGIDIAGENPGILPSQEWKKERYPADGVWYPGDTVNFGIGQGYMTVTPMQQAQVTAVLAAQGEVFHPRLVTGIRSGPSARWRHAKAANGLLFRLYCRRILLLHAADAPAHGRGRGVPRRRAPSGVRLPRPLPDVARDAFRSRWSSRRGGDRHERAARCNRGQAVERRWLASHASLPSASRAASSRPSRRVVRARPRHRRSRTSS